MDGPSPIPPQVAPQVAPPGTPPPTKAPGADPERILWAGLGLAATALGAAIVLVVNRKSPGKAGDNPIWPDAFTHPHDDPGTFYGLTGLAVLVTLALALFHRFVVNRMTARRGRFDPVFPATAYALALWCLLLCVWGLHTIVFGVWDDAPGQTPVLGLMPGTWTLLAGQAALAAAVAAVTWPPFARLRRAERAARQKG